MAKIAQQIFQPKKNEAKTETKNEAKVESKSEAKLEVKPEVKPEVKKESKKKRKRSRSREKSRKRSRSREKSRRRSRSRSRAKSKSRRRSRSRSRSYSRSRSRTRSRSRSRSRDRSRRSRSRAKSRSRSSRSRSRAKSRCRSRSKSRPRALSISRGRSVSRDYSDSSSDVVIVNPPLSNHVRRVSLSNPTNQNNSPGGPMRVNIPGCPPDAVQEHKPIATIKPSFRDSNPIDNEVVIDRNRDPRLRNQSTGSADDVLRFSNGQAVRDGPLNPCDSYTTSGGRNQCHIAKGNICKSFEEKWKNREHKMAGIGIGKYETGEIKDQERGINNNHSKHRSKPGPSKSKPSESRPSDSRPPESVTSKPKSLDEALSNFYEALPPLPSPPPGGSQKSRSGSLNPQGQTLPLPLPPPRCRKGSHPSISNQPKILQPKNDQVPNDQPKNVQLKNDQAKKVQPKINQIKTDQSKNGQGPPNHPVRTGYNPGQQQPRFRAPRPGPPGHYTWQQNAPPPPPHYYHGPPQPYGYPQPMMRPGRPMRWQVTSGTQLANQMAQWQQGYRSGQGQVWYPRHGHPPVRQNGSQRPPQGHPHWYNYY